MARFEKIPDSYLNSPDRHERKVLDFWRLAKVFEKSIEQRKTAKSFVFFEGPPTANGKPGIHHLFARTIKDIFPRYQTMMGKRVVRKAGWDTHGLPVELEVEKKLGISGKKQIESLKGDANASIAEFNRLCRESIFTYKKDWEALSERIAFWLDYSNPYITCSNEYIESVWYLLSRFYEKGMLYQGYKVLPYCSRCGTALSSHELGQPGGYRDVQDPSVYIRFKIVGEENTSFLVWTTTPWTLPSNVALAVSPSLNYVKIRHEGEILVLAQGRAAALFPKAEILETIPGKNLVGKKFFPLIEGPAKQFTLATGLYEPSEEHLFSVRSGDFVSSEDGTGIVHMAPAYGADDYSVALRDRLPVVAAVGADGRMKQIWPGFPEGQFFKDADKLVLEKLKQQGNLFRRDTVQHNYPFCWRCDTALMYFANPAWFLKTTAYKDAMIAANQKIQWVPEEIGEGRFGEWLENNVDWALSRERYWGTPLPIWECSCGERVCMESLAVLKQRANTAIPEDLHRPYIDTVTLRCEKCKGSMQRVKYVIDCWFDSGAMPYAQYRWPFTEESRQLLQEQFPADFIAEGLDQTRGWFYTLHAIATFLTSVDGDRKIPLATKKETSSAYKACVVNGLLLDKEGRKMSKRLGNIVDPWKAIEKDGVDSIRWYLLASGAPHLPKRFDAEAVTDTRRRFFGTLSNSLNFFALYANIDGYDPKSKHTVLAERPEIDRWIISRLNTLIREVRAGFDRYDLNEPLRRIEGFVLNELSNWYIRRNRRRFWKSEEAQDKQRAYDTLYETLSALSKLIAPVTPFFAEMMWHRLGGEGVGSVHLENYPEPNPAAIDEVLEKKMGDVLAVTEMGRVVRERVSIRIRQPLSKLTVHGANIEQFLDQIKEELNVKQVEVLHGDSKLFALKAKPNFAVLGKKAGKLMKPLQPAIANLSSDQIWKLREGSSVDLEIEGEKFSLTAQDVQIVTEAAEGIAVESNGLISIALDTHLSEELILEGIAREFVNRIQNLRKEKGFEVSDRIRIEVDAQAPAKILEALNCYKSYITSETLAEGGLEIIALNPSQGIVIQLEPFGAVQLALSVAG